MPARSPAPGGGAVAALVAALGAGLAAMAARFAPDEWEPRAELVSLADDLRLRLEPLVDADVAAFGAYLETGALDPIVDVPLTVAEAAAEVAETAARIAADGNPTVSGDAAAAAVLAAAASRVAARLVELNLGPRQDDRRGAAAALAARAERAAAQALAAAR